MRGAPVQPHAGIAVLYGNLAPGGAVIKPAAASEHLLNHRGRAMVFDSIEDMHARIDDPDLDVDADSVLVLRGCGPKGYPGMPEVANMPLPQKLLQQGVRDMVRICDGRMSGTAYGTVVLHVSPEAAAGGPLALVQTGDMIVLDVAGPSAGHRHPRRTSWRRDCRRRRPPPATPTRSAVGKSSTCKRFCRPTPELIWTSSSVRAAIRFRVSHTDLMAARAAAGEADAELLANLRSAAPDGVSSRSLDRLAMAHDASHYLLTPRAVVTPTDDSTGGRVAPGGRRNLACH